MLICPILHSALEGGIQYTGQDQGYGFPSAQVFIQLCHTPDLWQLEGTFSYRFKLNHIFGGENEIVWILDISLSPKGFFFFLFLSNGVSLCSFG